MDFTFESMNKDVSNLKNKKIQVYPNEGQREMLLRWMGTVRWVYNLITITSTSTVLPPIVAATHNPNFSGSTSGSSGSINASSNNSDSGPSGLVVGILVVGGIVLLGAISSACYCYRRHRLSLRYDEDDGGEVVLRGGYQDPFQSTLDQYHRTRY
ncbi:35457_t:CDS:2 [Gigaspora margarita]|uniref:35457_t:CDS:1 n=1 Tax=Gigaspora margarita TaxID=4874 RepID=A0ABN7VBM5_GIGMA|nr:35457_t:CDS:2 [Gigaspora margarita]